MYNPNVYRHSSDIEAYDAKCQDAVKESNERVYQGHVYAISGLNFPPNVHKVSPIVFSPEHSNLDPLRKKLLGAVNLTVNALDDGAYNVLTPGTTTPMRVPESPATE